MVLTAAKRLNGRLFLLKKREISSHSRFYLRAVATEQGRDDSK